MGRIHFVLTKCNTKHSMNNELSIQHLTIIWSNIIRINIQKSKTNISIFFVSSPNINESKADSFAVVILKPIRAAWRSNKMANNDNTDEEIRGNCEQTSRRMLRCSNWKCIFFFWIYLYVFFFCLMPHLFPPQHNHTN